MAHNKQHHNRKALKRPQEGEQEAEGRAGLRKGKQTPTQRTTLRGYKQDTGRQGDHEKTTPQRVGKTGNSRQPSETAPPTETAKGLLLAEAQRDASQTDSRQLGTD